MKGLTTSFVMRGANVSIREMTWKPDGSKMCFSSHNGSSLFSLYECNADGSGVTLRKNAASSNNAQNLYIHRTEIIFYLDMVILILLYKKADTAYDGSGYSANESTLLNSSGSFTETPLDWKNATFNSF